MIHVFPRHRKNLPFTVLQEKVATSSINRESVASMAMAVQSLFKKSNNKLDTLAFAHTGFFTSKPAEQLANRLIQHAPGNLEWAYFVSDGSEAVEAAIKLAQQWPKHEAVINSV